MSGVSLSPSRQTPTNTTAPLDIEGALIQLLDLTFLAPPFDSIGPPPPSTSELEVQFERVRSAYNLLGDELDRLASMVPVQSMGDTNSLASGFVEP
jgi:hypothetical protein